MTTNSTKRTTPPYLSVTKLDDLMDILATRSMKEISTTAFSARGFGKTDAVLAVGTLRFLGLVNENGDPTDDMAKIRLKGKARKQVFQDLIRVAYKELFETVEEPYKLPNDELTNEFLVHFHVSDRIVRTAVPAFLRLCEYAGLVEEGSVTSRKRKKKKVAIISNTKQKPQVAKHKQGDGAPISQPESAMNLEGLSNILILKDKMLIIIPSELQSRAWLNEELGQDLRKLVKLAESFAKKYIEGQEKNFQA